MTRLAMPDLRARLGPRGRAVARRLADSALAALGSIRAGEAAGRVALTFDDGPDPTTTRPILQALRAGGAVATYFLLVTQAERHPELVTRFATAATRSRFMASTTHH